MNSTLTTIIAGLIVGSSVAYLQSSARLATPILSDAIQWQSDTVNTYANLFPESSRDAVQQWSEREPVARERLESLRVFGDSGELTELERTTTGTAD